MKLNTRKIEIEMAVRNMSKTDLAEASGVSRQSISMIICRGTCEPKTAGKFAAGLGIPVEDLFEEA